MPRDCNNVDAKTFNVLSEDAQHATESMVLNSLFSSKVSSFITLILKKYIVIYKQVLFENYMHTNDVL